MMQTRKSRDLIQLSPSCSASRDKFSRGIPESGGAIMLAGLVRKRLVMDDRMDANVPDVQVVAIFLTSQSFTR